jgi:hypothetical protein
MISNPDNTIYLDIAVLCQEYTSVEILPTNNHIIELDEILIDENTFKQIFYPYGENFGLDKNICSNQYLLNYITFLPPLRSFNCGIPFSLLDQIINNIEEDLNVTRNCFTTESLIDLSKEISSIKYLCDINCCSLLSSLTWSSIMDIIRTSYKNRSPSNLFTQTLLVISVIFRNPDPRVLPTIIKFRYRMDINTEWI